MYELKKFKPHEDMSDETLCFSAELWLKPDLTWPQGVCVATVSNQGTGGAHEYAPQHLELFKDFEHYANAQPHEFDFDILDQYVDTLIEEIETRKLIKKNCGTKTLFRVKGDERGSWRTIAHAFDEKVKAHITGKYGDQLEAIGNEMI